MLRQQRQQLHHVNSAAPARLALAATITILLAIIVAPLLTSAAPPAPGGAKAGAPQAPQVSYALKGDFVNPTGASLTEFHTTYGSTTCSWCFYTNSTVNGTIGLYSKVND